MTKNERNLINVLKAKQYNAQSIANTAKKDGDETFANKYQAKANEIGLIVTLIEDKKLLQKIASIYQVELE